MTISIQAARGEKFILKYAPDQQKPFKNWGPVFENENCMIRADWFFDFFKVKVKSIEIAANDNAWDALEVEAKSYF